MRRFDDRVLRAGLACLCLLQACGGDETPSQSKNNARPDMDRADMLAKDMASDLAKADMAAPDLPPDMTSSDMAEDMRADMPADMMMGLNIRTLKDYRRCQRDNDCPVGLGSCVKEVALSHIGVDGVERVPLSQIFERLGPDEGVCTQVCTNDETICEALTLNSPLQDPIKHACQIIVLGASPYPEAPPAFPFADQLDAAQLKAGQPFGAICRPPFQMHKDIDDGLCGSCQPGQVECQGASRCWSALSGALAQVGQTGRCVSACQAPDDCPMGFDCQEVPDAGRRCIPLKDTCTACLDRDGDGRGAGRCGSGAQPKTPHDCDDGDPLAYYDDASPTHPFPGLCGQTDYNCNGLSDDAEQIGSQGFGAQHCTACDDACDAVVPNGTSRCQFAAHDGGLSVQAGLCKAVCDDPSRWADCDGDLSNGCETAVEDITRLYYRDADGDGHGDPNDVLFACDPSLAPPGYVRSDRSDCDDQDPAIYGAGPAGSAALELCDDKDNDCDSRVDEQTTLENTPCTDPSKLGVCRTGTYSCEAGGVLTCNTPAPSEEICGDNLDNDCDGTVDQVVSQTPTNGALVFYSDNDRDSYGSENATPVYACLGRQPAHHVQNNLDCNDNRANINPGALEICDGLDNDCDRGIDNVTTTVGTGARSYYIDNDRDTFGRAGASPVILCPVNNNPPPGYSITNNDCDDNDNQRAPGRLEICDNKDNNCDNIIDNVTTVAGTGATNFYPDQDNDGHGRNNATATPFCAPAQFPPMGYSSLRDDCNDNNADVNPSQAEICNRIDDNCRDGVDDGCPASISISAGALVSIDTNGDQVPDTSFFGTGSGPIRDFKCPDTRAIHQLEIGATTGRIVTIRVWCAAPGLIQQPSSGQTPYNVIIDTDAAKSFQGSFGNDYTEIHGFRTMTCDGDSLVRRVRIKPGPTGVYNSIVALEADCDDITTRLPPPNPATLQTSATPSASQRWGDFNANRTNYEVSCPPNQAVSGFRWRGHSNVRDHWISQLGVYCSPLNLTNR